VSAPREPCGAGKAVLKNRGRFAVAAVVAGLTIMASGSTASAAATGVYGPVKDDLAGKTGRFSADVYTNGKGVVTRVSFVEVRWLDSRCTGPDGQPFILEEYFGYSFPSAKVRKQAGKYVFSTSNGWFDELSATVTRNGQRLHGTLRVHQEFVDGELAGSKCDAQTTFKAKSYFLY
jgi:hypothetical protein